MSDNDNDQTDEVRTSKRIAEKDVEKQQENYVLKKADLPTYLINWIIKFIIFLLTRRIWDVPDIAPDLSACGLKSSL